DHDPGPGAHERRWFDASAVDLHVPATAGRLRLGAGLEHPHRPEPGVHAHRVGHALRVRPGGARRHCRAAGSGTKGRVGRFGGVSHYQDPVDGSTYPLDEPRWCSADGRPLWIDPGPGIGRDEIDSSHRSLWRYRAALPVDLTAPITLGEGCTPLLEQDWGEAGRVLVKAEWVNPTGR